VAQVIYGRRVTSAQSNRQSLVAGTAYAQEYGILTGMTGRIIQLGLWGGASSQPMNMRLGAYRYNTADGTPDTLIAATSSFVVSNNWTGGTSGASYVRDVSYVAPGRGATQVAAVVRDGERIFLGPIGNEAHSSAYATRNGQSRYDRTSSGVVLPDPFQMTSRAVPNREYTWWAVIEQNRPPVLSALGPDGIVTSDTTPDITFTFTDPDRTAGYGDYPARATVRMYEVVEGAYVLHGVAQTTFAPVVGTGSVVKTFAWNGTALQQGKSYVWTIAVEDEIGGAGGTAIAGGTSATAPDGSLAFDVNNKGQIVGTAPTGKQTSVTPATFSGTYTHPTPSNLDKVEVRLLKVNNLGQYEVVDTSDVIDVVNISSGGPTSVTWAQTGFPTLEWGADYAVEWRVTDAATNVSDWMGRTPFWTNRVPQQAIGVEPSSGVAVTSLPLVTFLVRDNDDSGSGSLDGEVEITGPYPLSNGGFDTNLTGWTYSETSASFVQTITRETASPHSGAGHVRISMSAAPANTTDTFEYLLDDHHPCVPGYTYGVDAWSRDSSISVETAGVIKFYSAADALLSTIEGSYGNSGSWSVLSIGGTAPANATYFRIGARGKNASSSPTVPYHVDFDDFEAWTGVRYLRDATFVSGDGFAYQMVSADAPQDGVYTLRARGKDANNIGSWSDSTSFLLTSGATATITNPASGSTKATASPLVEWTLDSGTQVRYRIEVLSATDGDTAYDSTWVTSGSDRAFVVEPGFLGNGESYVLNLWIDNGSVEGIADTVLFSVSYTAPAAPNNLQAVPFAMPTDPVATGVVLTWDTLGTDPLQHQYTEVWINEGGDDIRVARIADVAVTSFFYPFPRSGIDVEYKVRQIVNTGGNTVENGLFAQAFARVDLTHLSLVSVIAPSSRRVTIQAWPSQSEVLTQPEQAWHLPAGGRDYVEIPTRIRGRDLSWSGQIFDRQDESGITADDEAQRLRDLFDGIYDAVTDVVTPDILCARDPRGGKWFVRFNGNLTLSYGKGGVRYDASFGLRRLAYTEGQ
jgi:hypothetical protein